MSSQTVRNDRPCFYSPCYSALHDVGSRNATIASMKLAASALFDSAQPIAHQSSSQSSGSHRDRVEQDPRFSKELVDDYLAKYFSFCGEIDPNDELVFTTLHALHRRIANLEKVTPQALRLLESDYLLSGPQHKLLPEWMLQVLLNKIEIDYCLLELQRINLLHRHGMLSDQESRKALQNVYERLRRFDTIHISRSSTWFDLDQYVDSRGSSLQDFFGNFYVYPLYSGSEADKWAVIDISAVPSKDRKAIPMDYFTEEQIKADLGLMGDTPRAAGSVVSYDLINGKLVKREGEHAKDGPVKLFYEDIKKAKEVMGDRACGGRTRLTLEQGDVCRIEKPLLGRRGDSWTPIRERTAGVDRVESIWMFRLMFKKILVEGVEGLRWNDILNLDAYMEGVSNSDLAHLSGSYSQDSVFKQTLHFCKQMEARLQLSVKAKDSLSRLQTGLALERRERLGAAQKAVGEIFTTLENWKKAIGEFRDEYQKVDPLTKKRFEWIMQHLEGTPALIEAFIQSIGEKPSDDDDEFRKWLPDFLIKLRTNFKTLQAIVSELQMIYAEPLLRDQYTEYLKLSPGQFPRIADRVIPNFFQIFTRLADCLDVVSKNLNPEDSIVKEVVRTCVSVRETIADIEAFRSFEVKRLLALEPDKVLKRFFPHYEVPGCQRIQTFLRWFSSYF